MMKIGILETGEIHEDLESKHGEYPAMFVDMLRPENPDAEFVSYKVLHGVFPDSANSADAWVVTGSKYGVYEDLEWIGQLKEFLVSCLESRVPVAGICFGHQILAEALGGKVEKSSKGWGVGVHEYEFTSRPDWLSGDFGGFTGHAVHQDQIVELAPESNVIASSEFCQFAAVSYGDPEHPKAISVQSHPEFSAPFMDDLIKIRLADQISPELSKHARDNLGVPVNNMDWARWITRYFSNSLNNDN